MKKKVLAVVIAVTFILTACNSDKSGRSTSMSDRDDRQIEKTEETSTPGTAVTETTAEETAAEQDKPYQGIYVFGHYKFYDRDGNESKAPEQLSWLVVKEEGDRILLVSRFILDKQPYNAKRTEVTWETCSLRKWLNEDFYNTAFDSMDKKYILTVTNSNPDNAEKGTQGGNDTKDKVFLLSLDEYRTLVADEEDKAIFLSWWLRSPAGDPASAINVNKDGLINPNGSGVDDIIGVRPALWLDKKAWDEGRYHW